jgi:hypothetical protein
VFDWWDFLALAETLADGDEASRRTAVSRAYYAAFGSALAWQEGWRGFAAPQDGTVHQELWKAFDAGSDDERHVSELGNRLRRRRNDADYTTWVDGLGDMVDDSLDDAREVRDLLGRLTN